jgi:predicted enzyme related to lactoylglutathione lyase
MTEVLKHEPGTFCWTDLATTDQKAATKFYTSLFGWEARDLPIGEGETYTIFFIDGKDVCALHSQMADQKKQGIPPNWLAYVSVSNADETVKKIQSAGGRVLEGAFDVMEVGRMAVAQDPTGATFAIWQPKTHIGARIQEVPGSVCWRELMTQNMDQAGKFYSNVFGWSIDSQTFGKMNYTLLKKGENGLGGMITVPGVPNSWLTYWIVENCEQTAQKVKKLGVQIMKEPTKIPDVGTFAVLLDPQGSAFAVMQGEM